MYFPWPLLEAGLSSSTFCVSYVLRKVFVSYYLHAAFDRLSLTEINQHQTLISTVLNGFFKVKVV